MQEVEALRIKTVLDDSALKELEKKLTTVLSNLEASVDRFNKKAQIKADCSQITQKLAAIEEQLRELEAKRTLVLAKPKTTEAEKELHRLDTQVQQLTQKRDIQVGVDRKSMAEAIKGVSQITTQIGALASTHTKMAAGAFPALLFAEGATDVTLAAARYEALGQAMYQAGERTGYAQQALDGYVDSLRANGIAMLEARELVLKLVAAHTDMDKAIQLAAIAQDVAAASGVKAGEAFNNLVKGMVGSDVALLRSIGIQVDFEQAYANTAEWLMTTTEALSENEKMQARLNAILDASSQHAGAFAQSLQAPYNKLGSLGQAFSDIAVLSGKMGGETFKGVVAQMDSLTQATRGWLVEMEKTGQLESLGRTLGDVASHVDKAVVAFAAYKLASSGLVGQMANFGRALVTGEASLISSAKAALHKAKADHAAAVAALKAAEAERSRAFAAAANNTHALQSMELSRNLAKAESGVSLARAQLTAATSTLDAAQKKATLSARALAGTQTLAVKGVKSIITMLGGPWVLGISAAVTGLYAIATAEGVASATAKRYGLTLGEVNDRYTTLTQKAREAAEKTKALSAAQQEALRIDTLKADQALENAQKTLAAVGMITEIKRSAQYGQGMEVQVEKAFSSQEMQESYQQFKELTRLKVEDAAAAEDLELKLANLRFRLEEIAKENGGFSTKAKEAQELVASVQTAQAAVLALVNAFARLGKTGEVASVSQDLEERKEALAIQRDFIAKTEEGRRKALEADRDYEKQRHAQFGTMETQALYDAAEAKLEAHNKRMAGSTARVNREATVSLQQRYEAQKEIAARTITDEEDRTAALLAIERNYHSQLEGELQARYEAQLAQGKALSEAQIAELQRVQAEVKRLAGSGGKASLEALDTEHQLRRALIQQTVADEEEKYRLLLELDLRYAELRLAALEALAEAEMQANGKVSKGTAAEIAAIRAQIAALKGEAKGAGQSFEEMAKEFADYFVAFSNTIKDMVGNVGEFANQMYEAKIQSLDKSLERELRMMEDAHKQEMALYEDQLKQFEDIEERKSELKEAHAEAIAEIDEEMQEHLTEEQWRALEERRLEEDDKFTESMTVLEEETLRRDEIRAAQEQAEMDYMARKEQMEKDYAVKRAKMERQQAAMAKNVAMFSAVINVAQGITQALAQWGWPLGAVFAALVAAAGAIQIGTIAARPLPEIPSFYKGGPVGAANLHKYPNLPPPKDPRDKTLAYLSEGEYVLPKGGEAEAYQQIRDSGWTLRKALEEAGYAEKLAEFQAFQREMFAPQRIMVERAYHTNYTGSQDNNSNREVNINTTYEVKAPLTPSQARKEAKRIQKLAWGI